MASSTPLATASTGSGSVRYERGETVEVFFRFAKEPKNGGYFPCDSMAQGMLHPCIVKTDGWIQAVVEQTFDAGATRDSHWPDLATSSSSSSKKGTGKKGSGGDGNLVKVKYLAPFWYNRQGQLYNDGAKRKDSVAPQLVRKLEVPGCLMVNKGPPLQQAANGGQAPPPASAAAAAASSSSLNLTRRRGPKVSIFCVRWGGKRKVDAVTDGIGGWGQVGSNPSDNFIHTLFADYPYENFGTDYEIWTAFVQSTHELKDIHPELIRKQMTGQQLAGCYFLWPIGFQDGHEFCGYVNNGDLFHCMRRFEATGVVTRFPHHSHLYQLLASKAWTASWCLVPGLNTPLTTKLSRSMIVNLGYKGAAEVALQSLQDLNAARNLLFPIGQNQLKRETIVKGVSKLGYSWESMDVNHWSDVGTMAQGLEELVQQPGNLSEYVHVQEWVDIDVEMRHFVVLPQDHLSGIKIEKIVYTCYESKSEQHFSSFNRFDRETCLQKKFHNDEKALAEAEKKAYDLITRLYYALRGECSEMPPVIRFDVLAHRSRAGCANVMIGEITELGACFLGWPDGPKTVFNAMLRTAAYPSNHAGTWGGGNNVGRDGLLSSTVNKTFNSYGGGSAQAQGQNRQANGGAQKPTPVPVKNGTNTNYGTSNGSNGSHYDPPARGRRRGSSDATGAGPGTRGASNTTTNKRKQMAGTGNEKKVVTS
ncbi:unnamed protein product [Amoebophrya sp. A25]|nr:unnamed protein product [Amoebophrya sp. A25]|eukprot:GSA25T00004022001.1